MLILDIVYEHIRDAIAVHPPERGGALYGPPMRRVVTQFVLDANASTTAASYVPSAALIANVKHIERSTGLQFKGIVHSHPRGITRPSAGDTQTVSSFFKKNPHFSNIELPIVQQVSRSENAKFLYWYRAERRSESGGFIRRAQAEVLDSEFSVIPLGRHIDDLVARLRSHGIAIEFDPAIRYLSVRNSMLIGLVSRRFDARGHTVEFLISPEYPTVAPVVLHGDSSATHVLGFPWNGLEDPDSPELLVPLVKRLVDWLNNERTANSAAY